jgi:ferritin-like metal-binding protein YciE
VFGTRDSHLVDQLANLHAVEAVGLQVLELGCSIAGDGVTSEIYSAHACQTRGHRRLIEERLAAHDISPAGPEGACVRVGMLRIELDHETGPSPAELAVAAYTLENLEIGLYQLLWALARLTHDHQTEVIAQQILEQEESAAELIASRLHRASVAVS